MDQEKHTRLKWTESGPVWETEAGPASPPQWNSLEYQLQPRMSETIPQYAQRVGETVAAYVTYVAEKRE